MSENPAGHSSSDDFRLKEKLVDFCHLARNAGLPVGSRETLLVMQAAELGLLFSRDRFRLATRGILCNSPSEIRLFDELFARFWEGRSTPPRVPVPPRLQRDRAHSIPLLMLARGQSREIASDPGEQTTGASSAERLRRVDFSEVNVADEEELQRLAERLWRQMSRRLARRLKQQGNRGRVNLRRTIRKSLSAGGEPIRLCFSSRKLRRPRLVLLLDVSGSMEHYSLFLLQFIHALQRHFDRVESFVFSTRLRRISEAIREKDFNRSLAGLGDSADNWSSGTRIGECLGAFNDQYAARLLTPGTLVLILSDGLDTGEPERLSTELRRLRSRVRKLLWLNPLMGMDDFEPLATGIQTACRLVDRMVPAHNLESLLRLERDLQHV